MTHVKNKHIEVTEQTYEKNGWKFIAKSGGILPSAELDQWVDGLKLNNIPDVVFGTNKFQIINEEKNFVMEFNARDSLRFCNFDARAKRFVVPESDSTEQNVINVIPGEVQVKYAEHWKQKNLIDPDTKEEIKYIHQISDCFYSTPYKGTIRKFDLPENKKEEYLSKESQVKVGDAIEDQFVKDQQVFKIEVTKSEEIPISRLGPDNPIEWSSMIHLWEDELGDSGYTMSEFRFRVMGDCFFGLLRHYLRVDEVLIRIYDTRIFHDFKTTSILREFQVREASYQQIQSRGFQFTPEWMINPAQSHMIYNSVDQKLVLKEIIHL